ncbi:hypothetical protein HPP92_011600 [Vanilla planifolia]|uniref:Uncharacterized protein n=1 Tax=Vanilla planifolia TaxID=51239 RepID=A0A835R0Z5_VANPL|nr:hypothetical protein HPP92_011600 [Vanilla planifolia]
MRKKLMGEQKQGKREAGRKRPAVSYVSGLVRCWHMNSLYFVTYFTKKNLAGEDVLSVASSCIVDALPLNLCSNYLMVEVSSALTARRIL